MSPQVDDELSLPEYWNERYGSKDDQSTGPSHEWFRTFAHLRPFFQRQLPASKTNPRILHLGCGDSTLPADLYALGYTDQLCVDFSPIVIDRMRRQHPDIQWQVEDVREMKLDDETFDIAIDKGTMDAMIYGSQWDPPEKVRTNIRAYVDEVARVLRPAGTWLYITFRQPHFMKTHLEREGVWTLEVEQIQDNPGMFEYFAYIMTKKTKNS